MTLAALGGLLIFPPLVTHRAAAAVAPVECGAHRGGPTDHTEETEPTYSAAMKAEVTEVEGDVRWTSTGT